MMLFVPVQDSDILPSIKLFDALTKEELTEEEYFRNLSTCTTDEIPMRS